MRIQIWRSWRQLDGVHPNIGQQSEEFCAEQRVSIMNQVALAIQDSVYGIGEIPADLAHPKPIGSSSDACNRYLARRQLQEEQNEEPLQPATGPHFHGEEIGGHNQ